MDDIIRKILKDDTITSDSHFDIKKAAELSRHGFWMKSIDEDIVFSIHLTSIYGQTYNSEGRIVVDEATGLKKIEGGFVRISDIKGEIMPFHAVNNMSLYVIHKYNHLAS